MTPLDYNNLNESRIDSFGSSILSYDEETVLVFWGMRCWTLNAKTGKVMSCDNYCNEVRTKTGSTEYHLDSTHLFATTSRKVTHDRRLSIYDTRSRTHILRSLKGSLDEFVNMSRSYKFLPLGNFLACASDDGRVLLWDPTAEAGSVIMIKLEEECHYYNVTFSPDERRLIAWRRGGQIDVYDTRMGNILFHFIVDNTRPPARHIGALDIHPGGRYLAWSTIPGSDSLLPSIVRPSLSQIRFIDTDTGATDPIGPLTIEDEPTAIAFSPDGTMIAFLTSADTVQVQTVVTPFGEHSLWGKGDDSGWVLGQKGELLAWVPPEMREGFEWTPEVRGEAHGTSWTKCLVVEEE